MITPELLDQFLGVMRRHNVMSAHLESGCDKLAVTLGPEMPTVHDLVPDRAPVPGGWKSAVSDPSDPDPLGLGPLDAPLALEDEEAVVG